MIFLLVGLEQPAAREILLGYVMPRHPSAQNPLTAPISFKVKTIVPTMVHEALMSDALTSLTSPLVTLTLTYCTPDTTVYIILLGHTRTRVEHISWSCHGAFELTIPSAWNACPWIAAWVIPSHFLPVSLQMSFIRKAFPNHPIYKSKPLHHSFSPYPVLFFTTGNIIVYLLSVSPHPWGQEPRTVPGTWQEFCKNLPNEHVNYIMHRYLIKTLTENIEFLPFFPTMENEFEKE